MEEAQKAINLFSFIKGLNEIKRETITDIDKQIWNLSLSDLPDDNEYIQVFSRDRVVEDEVDSDMTILRVRKPEFDLCPEPAALIKEWLVPEWADFRKVPFYLNERTIERSDGSHETIRFNSDQERIIKYNEWIEKRKPWVVRQRKLDKIKTLFDKITLMHFDLQANSETEEMIIADGFLLDKYNPDINHPILSRRVKTEYDVENNIVSIVDTDNTSELYISMLRGMNDLNHDQLGKLNNLLGESDYHPLDRVDTPVFLKALIHAVSTDSIFSEDGIPENWKINDRFLLYLKPTFIVRRKLDGSIKAIESIIENIQETGFVPKHLLDIIQGGKIEIPEDTLEESIDQKLAAASGEDADIFLSKEVPKKV